MATIASLIGWNRLDLASSAAAVSSQLRADPEDYPRFARDAHQLDQDVRLAYADALSKTHIDEQAQDRHFLERAKEFVELNDQVETSTQLLTDLASFLSTFQTDLSAVSGHISELQDRSKTIEGRLAARKSVERSLQPYLKSIAISPALIKTILDTEVSPAWIPAIVELDQKLGAVRGGARVENRKQLDQAAEGLRVAATSKILSHLNHLLKPYTTSLPSLATLHAELSAYKPLFDFLRRHAARQAHEFQKNYTTTLRWYFETAFRRYVRGLEALRTRSGPTGVKWDALVDASNDSQASLALLNAKKRGAATPATSRRTVSPSSSSAVLNSRLESDSTADQSLPRQVIPAWQTSDKTLKPPHEQLFRSMSIVVFHNGSELYRFLDSFFGVHSSLPLSPSTTTTTPNTRSSTLLHTLDSSVGLNTAASLASSVTSANGHLPVLDEDGQHSDSGQTVVTNNNHLDGKGSTRGDRSKAEQDRTRKLVVEGLWKTIMEPALEYTTNFNHALLTPPSSPSPLSLTSMIHLNRSILERSPRACPPLEPLLYSNRLLLWPLFTKTLDHEIDSLRKINGTLSHPSGGGGLLGRMTGTGGSGTVVKDSTVQNILERYVEWFNTTVEICTQREEPGRPETDEEEQTYFQPYSRMRTELDKLLEFQSSHIPDPVKQKAFLRAGYQELIQGLSSMTLTTRSQAEIDHYRQKIRSVQ
ncbi:Vps52p [Sporobolomyces koalae]|uniref:Vps52p n=1 Tax=Sporobolomyces koalae TaxID=500713 RepID=UPI003174646A